MDLCVLLVVNFFPTAALLAGMRIDPLRVHFPHHKFKELLSDYFLFSAAIVMQLFAQREEYSSHGAKRVDMWLDEFLKYVWQYCGQTALDPESQFRALLELDVEIRNTRQSSHPFNTDFSDGVVLRGNAGEIVID